MEPLEQKLNDLSTDVKAFAAKAQEEVKNLGAVQTETKTALDAIRTQLLAQQSQLDAVDAKTQQRHAPGGNERKSLGDMLTEAPEYLAAKERGFMGKTVLNIGLKGGIPLERKTNITDATLGSGTTGLLMPVRLPGMSPLARQALRIRDVMNVTTQGIGNSFDYVTQLTRTNAASPQVEASAKSQSNLSWTSALGTIRTIAHYVQVSRQALMDVNGLRDEIDGEMIYGLKVKEEQEILSGDGTGVHLNGIITQATAFDTTYNVAAQGWQRLDQLRWAKLQARLAGKATYAPSAFVLHPTDLAHLEVTKDNYGHYIIGDPRGGQGVPMVWGIPVVESDSITAGTFLVGAFDTAAILVDRQQVNVDISFEHSTNFTENMATILCEERAGLGVKVPTAFITGSFSTSPATQN